MEAKINSRRRSELRRPNEEIFALFGVLQVEPAPGLKATAKAKSNGWRQTAGSIRS
jgi:hypothetical protein